jgi:hypothetical protein
VPTELDDLASSLIGVSTDDQWGDAVPPPLMLCHQSYCRAALQLACSHRPPRSGDLSPRAL